MMEQTEQAMEQAMEQAKPLIKKQWNGRNGSRARVYTHNAETRTFHAHMMPRARIRIPVPSVPCCSFKELRAVYPFRSPFHLFHP